jgi:hypothetical protein
MAVFGNSDELKSVMLALWHRIKTDPHMSGQLLDSRLVVQFRYREPEGLITVDASDGQEMRITWGPQDKKPVIEMAMKADVAHDFWMGRISVPVAILTGKMISKGPTPRALALLPVIRPAFDFYPEIIEEVSAGRARS